MAGFMSDLCFVMSVFHAPFWTQAPRLESDGPGIT